MTDSQLNSPEFAALVAASGALAPSYTPAGNDPWEASPFGWILKLPPRTKGAIGEKLVEQWAVEQGFSVRRPANTEADRIINGHRVEVKLSTLWANGGFKFQQIRDQEYDYCLCLGLLPHSAMAWLLPKSVLREHVIGHTPQHTGSGGTDTFWIVFQVDNPPEWLQPYGVTLGDVAEAFRALGVGPY